MKNILIITSFGPSLINFRLSLIKKLLTKGHKIYVASPIEDFSENLQKELIDLGVDIKIFKLSRTGLNFFKDLKTIIEILRIIKNLRPNIVISYTAKPVIYTGLLLKFFDKIDYYPLITGLGYAFTDTSSIKKLIFRYFIIKLYKIGLKNSSKIIFQNKDDQILFNNLKIINHTNLSYVVNGSGVDLNQYPLSKLPKNKIFLMVGRLLKDKGVKEYVAAAKIVRNSFPDTIFQLAGSLDGNPTSISAEELKLWIEEGNIQYLGVLKSVQSILKSCKFFVLPSYREGVPRSVLEALSTGRPIITTDTAGCRETVIHKQNGFLVPIKDTKALANAMISLINKDEKSLNKMANESYLIAKNKFEINKINQKMLDIMSL